MARVEETNEVSEGKPEADQLIEFSRIGSPSAAFVLGLVGSGREINSGEEGAYSGRRA
jgi:hypothetical protein